MERPASPAIRLRGVVKPFGALTAVDGLDFDVPLGSCVGLLGPNGTGKSTTMKALTAQVIADEGELTVLGHALPRDSKQARAEMGVVPQLDNLDVSLFASLGAIILTRGRSPASIAYVPLGAGDAPRSEQGWFRQPPATPGLDAIARPRRGYWDASAEKFCRPGHERRGTGRTAHCGKIPVVVMA
jgi:hypothetical protein